MAALTSSMRRGESAVFMSFLRRSSFTFSTTISGMFTPPKRSVSVESPYLWLRVALK